LWSIATHAKGVEISQSKWRVSMELVLPKYHAFVSLAVWRIQTEERTLHCWKLRLHDVEQPETPRHVPLSTSENWDQMDFLPWDSRYMTCKLAIHKVLQYGVRCRLIPNQIRAVVDTLSGLVGHLGRHLWRHILCRRSGSGATWASHRVQHALC